MPTLFEKIICRLLPHNLKDFKTIRDEMDEDKSSFFKKTAEAFDSPEKLLEAIEEAMEPPVLNYKPKPAIPLAFVSNHVDDGSPRSYAKYQLCRTKCGKHFIGICRGGVWSMKVSLENKADIPVPDDMEVEYWVDID